MVPVFGDQPANAIEAERRGYGVSIPIQVLTSTNLNETINKMLNDPKYTQKAEEHGSLVMDQMSKPMERAVWWIEYAIRHPGGMKHMRSPVHQLHWTQYFLLDIYAFLACIVFVLCLLLYGLCKCCCCWRKAKLKLD